MATINYMRLARMGYQAYANHTGNKNYEGKEMPAWDKLPLQIQQAWEQATITVTTQYYKLLEADDAPVEP